jgi:eukaryotic-like serine/threonine-protein kinase
MSSADWLDTKRIVGLVLEAAEEDRAGLLAELCRDRPDLRREVDSLLAAHASAGTFIDAPFTPDLNADDAGEYADADVRPGTTFGAYRILKELGRGGMGAVFLAERMDRAFEKHVAVKLVDAHVASPRVVARFLEERRILAALDHPGIARLLDAGATEAGEPYVVMEYVDGVAIDVHSRAARLTVRERVELFRRVCDAVHYAHQHLVVHRDIKAANILIAADGTPKLLDFGIAKLLDPESGRGGTADTALHAFTPEAASPEQVRTEPVTVATDIYSLGVLLYRLLAGRPPFDFGGRNDAEISRMICEQEPAAPSRIALAGGERVPRELDWIVSRAMRKEPSRRYLSAAQLSDDCGRFLTGEPLLAGPDTLTYRGSKFVRRHWVGVSAATLVVMTLAVTSAAILAQYRRAQRRFDDVHHLANMVVGELFDAIVEVPGTTAAQQLLVKRALEYLDSLAAEARGDVGLRQDLADAYQKIGDVQGNPYGANLGDVNGARATYAKLLTARQQILEARPSDPAAAAALGRAYVRIGDLDLAQAKYGDAVVSYQRALALLERDAAYSATTAGVEEQGRAWGRVGVALTWSGRRQEAKDALQNAIALTTPLAERPGASRILRRAVAINHGNLGDVFHYDRDFIGALQSHQHATDLARALLAEFPNETTPKRDTLMLLARVGADYVELGRHEDAIRATQESIALEESLIRADPSNVQFQFDLADMYANLAASERETHRLDEALRSIERSVALSEDAARRNPDYQAHQFNFGAALAQLGHVQRDRGAAGQADAAYRHAIDVLERVPTDQRDPTIMLSAYEGLGQVLLQEANRTGSRESWAEALAMFTKSRDGWKAVPAATSGADSQTVHVNALSRSIDECERALAGNR